jgi:hypothetical protein
MMSDVFDTKLNFVTCYLTWKYLTQKNPGWSVRNELTQLILVDPVDEEEAPGPQTRVSSTDNAI